MISKIIHNKRLLKSHILFLIALRRAYIMKNFKNLLKFEEKDKKRYFMTLKNLNERINNYFEIYLLGFS